MRDKAFLLILLALLGFSSFLVLKPFITYILFSIIFAMVTYPLYEKIKSTLKFHTLSALIVIVLIIVLIIVPSIYITAGIFMEARDIISQVGNVEFRSLESVEEAVSSFLGVKVTFADDLKEGLSGFATTFRNYLVGNIITFTKAVANFIAGIVLMFFIMFYLFIDGKRMVAQIKKQLPLKDKYKNELFSQAYLTTQGLFLGLFLTALIQGAVAWLGFYLFGVENSLFWGFVTAVFSVLPLLGPPVIYIPTSLVMIYNGNLVGGIGLLLYGLLVISNIDNFVRPALVKIRTDVHPLIVILGAVGGVSFIGFSGIVIGPLVLALFIEVVQIYTKLSRKR